METNDIANVWVEIERSIELAPSKGIVKRLVLPQLWVHVYLGIQTPQNIRMILLEIPYSVLKDNMTFPQYNGFGIEVKCFGDEEENHLTLTLSAKQDRFNDLFTAFVQDVLFHIDTQTSVDRIFGTLLDRLSHWERFLDRYREGLGEDAQRGLFGELHLLNLSLQRGIVPHKSVLAWTGPKHAVHDFQWEHCHLEVKTSISKLHHKMHIASERQLEAIGERPLYLLFLSLSVSSTTGHSLPDLVKEIRKRLGGSSVSSIFEDLLFEAGYVDSHEWLYGVRKYLVKSQRFFKIEDGFPKITENDLPTGVGDLTYTIMVGQCTPFEVRLDEFFDVLKEE